MGRIVLLSSTGLLKRVRCRHAYAQQGGAQVASGNLVPSPESAYGRRPTAASPLKRFWYDLGGFELHRLLIRCILLMVVQGA
jgi:hypothetical protein